MTDPTKARCDECGAEGRVFVEHSVRGGKRIVQWIECPACVKATEGRAIKAIAEAEKAGVA